MGDRFADRTEAGARLAEAVSRLPALSGQDAVVVALPRGGVPVAAPVARSLRAPLDVLVVRKLGHPRQPELGVGAIAEGGVQVLNDRLIARLGVDRATIDAVAVRETEELRRRVAAYRGDRPAVDVAGRVVVVVDDGLATGTTARAAVVAVRRRGAARVVLAVPVAAASTARELRGVADDLVCTYEPGHLRAVNQWYDDFRQVDDAEVVRLLEREEGERPRP